jgi:signal transduction histidine kinase
MKQGTTLPVPGTTRDRWQQRSRAFAVRAAHAEAELEQARQRVAAVERLVRHDVRTPLTVILGHAQMLAEGLVPPSRVEASYEAIQRQGERLNVLLERLATASAPAGRHPIAWVSCALDRHAEVEEALRGLSVCVCEPDVCEALREADEALVVVGPGFEGASVRASVQAAMARMSRD